jgi:hypothetical protein
MKQTSPITSNAIDYTWRQLARLVGVDGGFEQLGLPTHYRLPQSASEPGIFIVPCSAEDIHRLLTANEPVGRILTAADFVPGQAFQAANLPMPLWGVGAIDKPFAVCHPENRQLVIYADILALTFILLSRWEETLLDSRDLHGRFPAASSIAYRQGFLDRPLLDEIGLTLQGWLQVLLPDWTPRTSRFTVSLSHDLDHLNPIPARTLWRETTGDLVTRRNLPMALDSLAQILTGRGRWRTHHAVRDLVHLSERYNFNSAFYVLIAQPSQYDEGYSLEDPAISMLIKELHHCGLEVGLHPGYDTLGSVEKVRDAKERLEGILGADITGGRQHYLRFSAPATWRHWVEAGLSYDSTLGYAEVEGFRCSTCKPYPVFDVEQDRELPLEERPLIVMDATLRQYRKLSPADALARILSLAGKCQAVGGTFTLLWHNTSLLRDWQPWRRTYICALQELAAMAAK